MCTNQMDQCEFVTSYVLPSFGTKMKVLCIVDVLFFICLLLASSSQVFAVGCETTFIETASAKCTVAWLLGCGQF